MNSSLISNCNIKTIKAYNRIYKHNVPPSCLHQNSSSNSDLELNYNK